MLLSPIIVAALLDIVSAGFERAVRPETLLLPCLGIIQLLCRANLVSLDSVPPSFDGL